MRPFRLPGARTARIAKAALIVAKHVTLLAAVLLLSIPPMTGGRAQGGTVMNDPMTGSAKEHNRATVAAAFAAWRDGSGTPFDLLAEDATWTIEGQSDAAGTYAGRESFLREVIRPFNARMRQGLKPTLRGLYADGDSVIIFFDAQGVAGDGQPYSNSYAWFWEMQDGRVVRAHAFFDSLAFNALWRRVAAN
jgi:uncharacterized protein